MSKIEKTKRKIMFGNNRSKALNITKRKWKLNLQKQTYKDKDGNLKTRYLSVKEIKTIKKEGKLFK